VDGSLLQVAREARGFMPEAEGLALNQAALSASAAHPWVEIGSYCGKSAVYLGAAALEVGTVLYSIDHHRGSEEHQAGEEYHDPALLDPVTGRIDSLPEFNRTIQRAGLERVVLGVVGESAAIARMWRTSLSLVFIDGGHSEEAAHADYEGWAPHLVRGSFLIIHDVFEDTTAGGRPPFEIYSRALDSGAFEEVSSHNSLRVLERVGDGI
jgi:MMP 1-O-methyltransferase